MFIALGILIGCVTTEKSASGVSSVVVQLVAFTSGMYFSTDMVGAFFAKICNILPFSRCVDITKGILNNNYENLLTATIIFAVYTIAIIGISIVVFKKKNG